MKRRYSNDNKRLADERKTRVGRDPHVPTEARAGSAEKLAAMVERAARGEGLFHRNDNNLLVDRAPSSFVRSGPGRIVHRLRLSKGGGR